MKDLRFPLHIGPRTIKTAIAVILAMIIVDIYGATSSKLVFAMLGAMAAIEPTIKESLESCRAQVIGVLLGALAGVLLRSFSLPMLVNVGLGIILVISFYNLFRIPYSPSLPCLIVVMICTEPDIQPMTYALGRIWDSAIGLGVGLLVNALILPYDNSRQIRAAIYSLDRDVIRFLEDMFDGDEKLPDSGKTSARVDEIARQLAVFSKQRLPFKREKQRRQLEQFRLCERKARQLLSRLEVLSQVEQPGQLTEQNRALLAASGARIPEKDVKSLMETGGTTTAPPTSELSELDTVINYHVRRILILRQELLAALRKEEPVDDSI